MNRMAILTSVALLVSCAGRGHFPVQSYGPDTFVVHVGSYSASKARRAAVKTANEYCGERNLVMMPDFESAESSLDPWAGERTDVEFVFRCHAANDPRLRPPEMRPTQRVIIEDD
jgi:hypothetical protein